MDKLFLEGDWFDAYGAFLGKFISFSDDTGLSELGTGSAYFIELLEEIKSELNLKNPWHGFRSKNKTLKLARKEALVYLVQHGDQLWAKAYERVNEALPKILDQNLNGISEQKLQESVVDHLLKFSSELASNPFARFFIDEIYKAESNLIESIEE